MDDDEDETIVPVSWNWRCTLALAFVTVGEILDSLSGTCEGLAIQAQQAAGAWRVGQMRASAQDEAQALLAALDEI